VVLGWVQWLFWETRSADEERKQKKGAKKIIGFKKVEKSDVVKGYLHNQRYRRINDFPWWSQS